VVLFASAFVANRIGINVIVGGFVAGAILPARVALFRDLSARLAEVTGVVLLPIFLAFSGLNTDFTQLGASFVVGIVVFVAAGIVGKWLGSAVFARLGGLTWTEGNAIGVLMNCRGLLVLVVALIGFEQQIISAPMQVAGVVMALITTMMTGPLFDRFYEKLPQEEAR
jgi:Kef-type K+ transport system membrane component KefB